ncbi:hypothetical protein H8S20_07740 [Clostridium sp. NSJ-6]|uniref:Lipoprotein n=1 Tax=Clostridium hominis TaxID=2763036 RepID=A0ABR7DBK3_9CLOT|nr:hypothetical protein [Clostridium hominis]MBC5628779.1 hypothetical protein [Clostridium hominis]MDU2671667.1 hypothetical protein [Clostridium sp.]
MVKNILFGLFIIATVSFVSCNHSNLNVRQEEEIETGKEVIDGQQNSFKSEVLLENEIVKIVSTGIDENSSEGSEIKVEIENKIDKTIVVQAMYTSVNNLMSQPMFMCELLPKEKATDSIVFFKDSIEELKNIEGFFSVFDKDGWETIGNYPFAALVDENSAGYNISDNGLVLIDNEAIKCIYTGQGEDNVFGPYIMLEIENKIDDNVVAQIREISVNGSMMDPLFISEISAGKTSRNKVKFYEEDVNGFKDVEGKIHVFSGDTGDTIGDYPFSIIE